VPGIIALSAMTTSFNAVGSALNMSRLYHKTLEEYLIAPISPGSFVTGKVLAGCVRGVIASLLILGLAFLFGAHIMVNVWFFLLPLTHTSYSLRAIATGGDFLPVSLAVLLGYAVVFFTAGVIAVRKAR